MSYIVLGHDRAKGTTLVLDTTDLVVESLSREKLNKALSCKLQLFDFYKSNSIFGIRTRGSSYKLYIHGYDRAIYSGNFPSRNNRGDLFDMDIKVHGFGKIGNKLCVVVCCTSYCRYDVEMPMAMFHVISIPISNIQNGAVLSCYTGKPIHLCTKDIYKHQSKVCDGDYPLDCSLDSNCLIDDSYNNELKILGVSYGRRMPVSDDVCKRLKFFK